MTEKDWQTLYLESLRMTEPLRAENEAHREAQQAVYLALGTGDPNRETWPDAIKQLRSENAALRAENVYLRTVNSEGEPGGNWRDATSNEIERLRSEVEALKKLLKGALWLVDHCEYENDDCQCEPEVIDLPEFSHPGYYCIACQWNEGMSQLRAEVNRFDAARAEP